MSEIQSQIDSLTAKMDQLMNAFKATPHAAVAAQGSGHRVHECAAMDKGRIDGVHGARNLWDGDFPDSKPGASTVAVQLQQMQQINGTVITLETRCPYCGVSSNEMRDTTEAQRNYLEGKR